MRSSSIGVVVAVLIHASLAAAEPGPVTAAGPPIEAPPIEEGIRDDAASGRTWMSPTALTPPAGTFSAQNVQILFLGASYSPTDRLALSANVFVPLPGAPWIALGGVKLKVADLGQFKVGAHLGLGYLEGEVREVRPDGRDERVRNVRDGIALLGGIATACLDRACHSLLNGYLSIPVSIDHEGEVDAGLSALSSVAWVQRVTRRWKLALEVFTLTSDGDTGVFGWYGARYTRSDFAFELGMIRIFCDACEERESYGELGLPWLSFTFRAL